MANLPYQHDRISEHHRSQELCILLLHSNPAPLSSSSLHLLHVYLSALLSQGSYPALLSDVQFHNILLRGSISGLAHHVISTSQPPPSLQVICLDTWSTWQAQPVLWQVSEAKPLPLHLGLGCHLSFGPLWGRSYPQCLCNKW